MHTRLAQGESQASQHQTGDRETPDSYLRDGEGYCLRKGRRNKVFYLLKSLSPCREASTVLSRLTTKDPILGTGILHLDTNGSVRLCSTADKPHPSLLQHMLHYAWMEPPALESPDMDLGIAARTDLTEDGALIVTCVATNRGHGALLMGTGLQITRPDRSNTDVQNVATLCALAARAIFNRTGGLRGECATRGEETQQRGGQPLLTQRQVTVLNLIAQGLTNPQIARRISYSASTVRMETIAIHRALGVRTRHEAVRVAKERGILTIARAQEEQCKGP